MELDKTMQTLYADLIRSVGIPGVVEGLGGAYRDDLMKLATLNKIQLLYSQMTGFRSQDLPRKHNIILDTLSELCRLFNDKNISYAVFKTIKPFPNLPSDIDILIDEKHIQVACTLLGSNGYVAREKDMFCITMHKETNIDLYLQPSVSNVPYLSKDVLMYKRKKCRIGDIDFFALSNEAEFIAVAAHSIYKEQMLTLNDFITLAVLANNSNIDQIIRMANTLNVLDGIKLVLQVCGTISETLSMPLRLNTLRDLLGVSTIAQIHSLPYKFPIKSIALILMKRTALDSNARRYVPKIIAANLSIKQLRKLLDHAKRETY
jgi:hypothetical protein